MSGERLSAATASGQMGTWVYDPAADEVAWSGATPSLLGAGTESRVSYEAFLGHVHPEDRAGVDAAVRAALDGAAGAEFEFRAARAPANGPRWLLAHATPLARPDGGQQLVGTLVDISARVSTEEVIRERMEIIETLQGVGEALTSRLEHRDIVQLVTDEATAATGADFGAFFYNSTNEDGEGYLLYTLSGAPREAFDRFGMPRRTPMFDPTFAGSATVRHDDVLAAPEYGRMAPHYGMPEGHLPVRSYLATPVIGADGTVIGGLFFGHKDVGFFTERSERLVEGIARWASVALDNARLFAAERLARSQAEAASRAREEVLAVVTHDLRNPLNTILASTTLLLNLPLEEEERRRHTESVQRTAHHMSRLIGDLLDVVRLGAGRFDIHPSPTSVAQIVTSVLEQYAAAAQEQGTRLEAAEADGLPDVQADFDRVVQALANLVSNALRFTPAGGRVAIRAQAGPGDGEVTFAVEDDGCGIPADALDRVFDRFWQAAPGEHGGIGLGLAIVAGIAQAHGGSYGVESEEGRGSRFWITLPAVV